MFKALILIAVVGVAVARPSGLLAPTALVHLPAAISHQSHTQIHTRPILTPIVTPLVHPVSIVAPPVWHPHVIAPHPIVAHPAPILVHG